MKKIFIATGIICFLWLSFGVQNLFAQPDESKAEIFSRKVGNLIESEFVEIGKIKNAVIEVVIYKDLVANTRFSAVKFSYANISRFVTPDTKVVVLDSDEIDGLIKALTMIQNKILPQKRNNYTEINFKSRGGFEAGCFFSKEQEKWSGYINFIKGSRESYIWLDPEDFSTLVQLLEEAKKKL